MIYVIYYVLLFFFVKQKTAYEMRISDWVQTCALPISARPGVGIRGRGGWATRDREAAVPRGNAAGPRRVGRQLRSACPGARSTDGNHRPTGTGAVGRGCLSRAGRSGAGDGSLRTAADLHSRARLAGPRLR